MKNLSKVKFKNNTFGTYDETFIRKIGTQDNFKYVLTLMNYVKNKGIEKNIDSSYSRLICEFYQVPATKNDIKLYESISRAKRTIKELAFCNEWQWFFTGTLDSNKYDRTNLEKFHKDFTQFLRDFKKNNKLENKIDFLVIPELHSDGKSWHLHGFLNNLPVEYLTKFEIGMTMSKHILKKVSENELVYKWNAYEKKFGFNDIEPIKNHEAVSNYITKYISKELGNCVREVGAHLYYHSRGLKVAELIKKGHMNWNFDMQPYIKRHIYSNEYCKILELTPAMFDLLGINNRFYI